MFKIGNRAIYQPSIRAAISEAKKNGFAVLEIHLTSPQFMPHDFSKKELLAIKKFSKKQGIILQTHAPLEQSLIFTGKELRRAAKDQIKTMIRFSRAIGARRLTLHPGKAATYHTDDGRKLKDDELFPKFYSDLFEDSIKNIISISPKDFYVCVENTDNFTLGYQKILNKYLPTGKVFLTWDIRKNYTYTTSKLIEQQWKFVQKNKNYVKNLHVSGFNAAHGELKRWEDKFDRFIKLFSNQKLPMIIEIMPLQSALEAKKIINRLVRKYL
jgi:sugar phosphate isomerase/epimerase